MQSALKLKMKRDIPQYADGGITQLMKKPKPKGSRMPKYAEGSTVVNQYTSNIPDYAKENYSTLVGKAQALSDQEYQPYNYDRQAQFTDLQNQGFSGLASLGATDQSQQASGIASTAATRALNSSYGPSGFSTYGSGPQQVSAYGSAPMMTGTQSFLQPGTAGAYMNPYMQNVVDTQKREAVRSDDIARTSRNAQAVGAGAFGGSRQAIQEAEANRNLQTRLGDIQTTGSDAAFKQAQAQFNTEQGLGLQSQQANQTAGLNFGNQYLQAQQANQTAGLNFGNQFLDAQKMAEASKQFGATYGLQGLQTGLQGATALSGMGNDLFKQEQTAAASQVAGGTQQQQNAQAILDQQYADYQKQLNHQYQQLGFMSDILRGTQGTVSNVYGQSNTQTPNPSTLQTLAGLGSIATGLSKAKGGSIDGGLASIAPDDIGDFADGGIVGYAEAGSVRSPYSEEQRTAAEGRKPRSGFLEWLTPYAGQTTTGGERPSQQLIPQMSGNYAEPRERFTNLYATQQDTPARERDAPVPVVPAPVVAPVVKPNANTVLPPAEDEKSKYDIGASMRLGSRATGTPGMSVEQLLAARGKFGVDYDAASNAAGERARVRGEKGVEESEQYEKDLAKTQTEGGIAGLDREKKLKGRLDEIGGRTEQAKKDALITAGLGILMAKPGGKGWRGAIAPIAEGASGGIRQLRTDERELRSERAKLDDSMDALLEARRQEGLVQGKERLAAKRETGKAKLAAQAQMDSVLDLYGAEKVKGNSKLLETWAQLWDSGANRVDAASRENAGNDAAAARYSSLSGTGGAGGKPMTEAQRNAEIDRVTKMLAESREGRNLSVAERRAAAERIVMQGTDARPPGDWSVGKQPDPKK